MSDTQDSRAGSMFGPYRLKRLLGRGGMGEVYEAEHTVKEWTVAVKVMTAEFSTDPVFRERMKREARIAGRLKEPHVVPIHDYGEIEGQLYLEMRLIEGTDLDSVLKRFGPLTPPRAVAIISQVASALDAAHTAGVMHRDVKPPNILITRDDFAYLVDFGIASATTDEKLTQLGTAVGTWKYMAPERFSNDEVTYRADIYALACVLYECLTGSAPYRSGGAGTLISAHMMDPIPQPSASRAGIPKALDAVIARGMAKKPEDRYISAGDLALAAHEALSEPDQDHAANIVRRSQEATLPRPTTSAPPPTIAATRRSPPPAARPATPSPPTGPPASAYRPSYMTPQPPPVRQPPYSGPGSGPVPRSTPPSQPGWAPSSGPVPTPNSSAAGGQYYQSGSSWGGQPPQQQPGGPSSWQQEPAKRRTPWLIIAIVGVVLIVVVGGIVILGLRQVGGDEPKKPPPPPIAADRLSALLLSTDEINGIMGATNMTGKPYTTMGKSSLTLSDPSCLGVLVAAQEATYSGTGYTGVNENVSSEPGKTHDHFVDEAVVTFPSADKAREFLQTSQDKWKACAGKTITVTDPSEKDPYRWSLSDLQGQPQRITLVKTQEAGHGWQCQRVMSVANNVIVDVQACTYKINDQAGQISDRIIGKVNTQ
jgi:serine/threonine kinase PknH